MKDFRWIGPYIIEKVLPSNNFMVRKTGTNKTQMLHGVRMRQFTPRHHLPDIRITPQERKPVPEVSTKHDDLYARAWECEYDRPNFDAEKDNPAPPKSPQTAVRFDISTEGTLNIPETARERYRKILPQTEQICDVTDAYPYMEPDAETSSGQPNNIPSNPRSSIYNLRHNTKPNCNDDYIYYQMCCTTVFHGTNTWRFLKF